MISESPLGMHLHRTNVALDYLRGLPVKPSIVKVLDAPGDVAAVKSVDPAIKVVLRYTAIDVESYLRQGQAGGRRFVAERNWGGADFVAGPNEVHGFDDPAQLDRVVQFFIGFARECANCGFTGTLLSLAVGNPADWLFPRLVPLMEVAAETRSWIDYRIYGPSRPLYDRQHYAGRWFESILPALRSAGFQGDVPVMGGEAGYDTVYYPEGSGPIPDGPWRPLVGRGVISYQTMQDDLVALARYLDAHGCRYALLYDWWAWNNTDDTKYDFARDPAMMLWYRSHLQSYRRETPPAPPPPSTTMRVAALPYANIRSAPRVEPATDIGDVYSGALVDVLGREGEWYHVRVTAAAGSAPVIVVGWMHQSVLVPA